MHSGPYLTAGASQHLVQSGVVLVRIDGANIDKMQNPAPPAHSILLAADSPVVEHVRGLEELNGRNFRFLCRAPGDTRWDVISYAELAFVRVSGAG